MWISLPSFFRMVYVHGITALGILNLLSHILLRGAARGAQFEISTSMSTWWNQFAIDKKRQQIFWAPITKNLQGGHKVWKHMICKGIFFSVADSLHLWGKMPSTKEEPSNLHWFKERTIEHIYCFFAYYLNISFIRSYISYFMVTLYFKV